MRKIAIGRGHVFHSRSEGARNTFRYPTFFVHFNCAEELALKSIFKKKFFGFLSMRAQDYLDGAKDTFENNIRRFLKQRCEYDAEEVSLHTLPRMFGYAFNPVSFWLCRRDGKLEAALIEVNNTFGERHFYWMNPGREILSGEWLRAEKVFHVSPFFPIEGYYLFRFRLSSEDARIDINYHAPSGDLRLATSVEGALSSLDESSLFSVLKNYGWMTPMVVIRIHLQAVKLWFRKVRFHVKPPLPENEITK